MIFYFSGTGNSKWIAEQLGGFLHEKLVFIPQAIRDSAMDYHISADETIGFVFPVYSWGPPPIVLHFIERVALRSDKKNPYLYFVCSCGDDIGLTQQVFCDIVATRGWRCDAGFSVPMPNNYVLLPGFDVDPKEIEVRKLKEAVPLVKEIGRLIEKRETVFLCEEGRFPFIKTRIINPLFTKWGISPEKFYATDACVACKRCEKACPMNNVVMVGWRPVWGTDCASCLACYHICPQQAIHYGKATKKKGQYFNPNKLIK